MKTVNKELKHDGTDFFFRADNEWDAKAAVECIQMAGYQSIRRKNDVYYPSGCPDWLLRKAASINTL